MSVTTENRFRGCLLGLALGDALGGRFEAQTATHIRGRYPTVERLIDSGTDELWYTDDTQMAIGIAETLATHSSIIEEHLCEAFVANYVPSRGYGRGARTILDAMEDGRDYKGVANSYFPGGSYGNGAAMRVAPVGLFFRDELSAVHEQARLSALPTHVHPLGIEGAQILALAVAIASQMEAFDHATFFGELAARCLAPEFSEKMERASSVASVDELELLGNGIEALESVPTAIACFSLNPNSYELTIGNAILLGGDTDTIAAMAGAISGAYNGQDAIPANLLGRLEESPKGRNYIGNLANRLFTTYKDARR